MGNESQDQWYWALIAVFAVALYTGQYWLMLIPALVLLGDALNLN